MVWKWRRVGFVVNSINRSLFSIPFSGRSVVVIVDFSCRAVSFPNRALRVESIFKRSHLSFVGDFESSHKDIPFIKEGLCEGVLLDSLV